MDKSITLRSADNIRILSAAMVEKAASGHPGGAMGGADFINILYSEFLRFDPDDCAWPFRDRFFLDPGHMSAMLYSQLTLCRLMSLDDIKNFRQWKSPTPGHPELDIQRGIENTSGPLGQGHAFGAGAAIAERFLVERFGPWMSHRTYIYISDGGIQEEISQGVGRIAGYLGLGNIIMFYDANDVQLSTKVGEVTSEDTAKKYESWHWHVVTIDGNDEAQIREAIKVCQSETSKPSLIIGRTVMGKGAVKEDGTSHEGMVETHGKPLGKSKASFAKTIENLGGDPANPFAIFPEVSDHYKKVLDHKRKEVKEFRSISDKWSSEHPEAATTLNQYLSGTLPNLDFSAIELAPNDATRNASSRVLAYLAEKVGNMIVASADLSNSDMTDGFLKKTKAFTNGDFSGAFLQAGVSELTMAALSTGMALHGGVIPVCATFFAFSDYMKPVLRVAALMEQPVRFIWTHDAFRVGEDGPTHQPIEQEAQLRLLEKLYNHSGKPSFVALRPADSAETVSAWELMLSTKNRPSGLILSRQNIKDIPALESDRLSESRQIKKGAYVVYATSDDCDITLLANGSEVATLIEAAPMLEQIQRLRVRVVSVPSEGIFRTQPTHYQHSVLPDDAPVFGLTAGLPVTLEGLIKDNGMVFGMTHFGYSAPYPVLDEKFGFTPQNVVEQVKKLLADQ
ncbi:MAG: transketolase [Saprospiraceae bacterium]|nr:transketolase [Saprospiraceae bacterium]MBP6447474.1 transketolase [Saprospiraceae bacterium]